MHTHILRYISILFLIIIGIAFISFFYTGLTTRNPVSLDYNLQIAQTIATGEFLHLHSDNPYIYFPGSSHSIMALFLLLDLPINLYGLLSWVVLFFACKKAGNVFGLKPFLSIIFAASICTLISVARTVGDQSIDKWLCTWFIFALTLLENPKLTVKWSIFIGVTLGMLVGTKYSGPFFFIALTIVYIKTIFQYLDPKRFSIATFFFTVTGLFWYIRNFTLTGSPLYPANLPFLKGYPHFTQQDWVLWKIPIIYPQALGPLFNAFLSEYLVWAFATVVILFFLVFMMKSSQKIDRKIFKIILLCLSTGIACLFLPVTPPYKIELFHIISDMRYMYIFVAVEILGIFLIAQYYKKELLIATIAIINAFPLFSFIPFQPKLFLLAICIFLLLYPFRNKILPWIYNL